MAPSFSHSFLLFSLLPLLSTLILLLPTESEPRLSSDFWDELIQSGNLPAYVTREELAALQVAAGLQGDGEDREIDPRPDLQTFPFLDTKQRRFAVNPGFKSYYDSSFKEEEGVIPDETGKN